MEVDVPCVEAVAMVSCDATDDTDEDLDEGRFCVSLNERLRAGAWLSCGGDAGKWEEACSCAILCKCESPDQVKM